MLTLRLEHSKGVIPLIAIENKGVSFTYGANTRGPGNLRPMRITADKGNPACVSLCLCVCAKVPANDFFYFSGVGITDLLEIGLKV